MTGIFKVKIKIAPQLIKDIFQFVDLPYNMRNWSKYTCSIACTERYSIETASFIGPKLWSSDSTEIKKSQIL